MHFRTLSVHCLLLLPSLVRALTLAEIDTLRVYPTTPPPDAAVRRARFAARNQPAELAALAQRLARLLDLEHGDLSPAFTPLYRAQRYAEALDAYRDYFLDKITYPEKYGIGAAHVHAEDPDIWPIVNDMFGDEQLLHSTPAAELMAHRFIMEVAKPWDETDGLKWHQRIRFELGEPGAINWAYVPPIWSNPAPLGPHMLEWRDDHTSDLNWCPLGVTAWARQPAYFGRHWRNPTCFRDLLSEYARTGETAYLDKWAAYIDDYALHQRADADASPYNLLASKVQQLFMFDGFVGQLAFVARERPEFARQLPAPTLARILARCMPEAAGASVRQSRFFEGNWRYMLIGRFISAGLLYREYVFSDLMLETARRIAEQDAVRGNLPDGSDYEITPNYWGMMISEWLPILTTLDDAQLPWFSAAWRARVQDQIRLRLRAMLANQRPDGRWHITGTQDWRPQYREFDARHIWQACPEFFAAPDNARRLNRAFGVSRVTGEPFGAGQADPPGYASEWLPYGGWYYLRAGWGTDDHHGFMQNHRQIVGNGGQLGSWQPNNALHIHGYGAELLFIHNDSPVLVDSGRQDKNFGLPVAGHSGFVLPKHNFPTPMDARWLDSDESVFAEGSYDGAFGPEPGLHIRDWLSGRELDMRRRVTDVVHTRQVHMLKASGLWVVTDRLDSELEHAYTQRWHLHVPEQSQYGPVHGFAPDEVEIDYARNRVRTHSTSGPNVSLYQFGTAPSLVLESRLARVPEEPIRTWTTEGRDRRYIENNNYLFAFTISRVHTHFRGQGRQALVSVVFPRRAASDELAAIAEYRHGERVLGFDAVLADGEEVGYRLAVDGQERLSLHGVAMDGESLLVTRRADGRRYAVALGASQLKVDRRPVSLASADAEVIVPATGPAAVHPVYRPIAPVRIEPAADVFAAPIQVSLHSATPGVAIHYTLDGSAPDADSPVFTAAFPVAASTTVRARAFRPGVPRVPSHLTGTEVSAVTEAHYRRLQTLPAQAPVSVAPGLAYRYYEGDWHEFILGLRPAVALREGTVEQAIDITGANRHASFLVVYEGYLRAPQDGIYTLYSPQPMFDAASGGMNLDAGYDLQVWVDGQKWYPGTQQHGFGTWSVALAQGLHELAIHYADFRGAKPDLCFAYAENRAQWRGPRPELEISGPALPRQPLPASMVWHPAAR